MLRSALACVVCCLAMLWPLAAAAQEGDAPLGDVARNLRKSKAQQQVQPTAPSASPGLPAPAQHTPGASPVIDNDNLAQALDDLKRVKSADRFVFSVDPAGKNFKVSSPDVTCNLSFNARVASLLIKPVIVEDLPVGELAKLDGPASIQDDNLQMEVFNGTEWELREITVGITLERKAGESAEIVARARVIPAAESLAQPVVERHSDVTVLYHLKATAKPFSTTVFREAIGIGLAGDQEWRWSIVEAKGIRPQGAQPALPEIPAVLPTAPWAELGKVPESGAQPKASGVLGSGPEADGAGKITGNPATDKPGSAPIVGKPKPSKLPQEMSAAEKPAPSSK